MLEIGLKRYYFPKRERKMTAKQIGKLIRDTRKIQGLRQDELAAAAGVGLRFLVELEAGKETAQLGKTLSVLSALGCAIDIKPTGRGRLCRKKASALRLPARLDSRKGTNFACWRRSAARSPARFPCGRRDSGRPLRRRRLNRRKHPPMRRWSTFQTACPPDARWRIR